MHVEILTPEKKVFSGDVYGVQLPGTTGSFEVLDNHAPLVSSLKKGVVKILKDKTGQNTDSFNINGGFIEVINNQVSVLVEGV